MAMSLSLSPATDALPAHQASVDNNNNSSNSLSISNNSIPNNGSTTPPNNDFSGQVQPSSGPKRKPSRRANTAERRATHNAVERQRRETLNGRFLDLAALLPNLSQIRRPSKSSIVNSSIAHVQASRRHRLVASRELKMLKIEADALRREVNEWRDRASLPRVDEAPRGDGFAMVISGELEVIQGIAIEEEDEDGEDGFGLGQPIAPMPGISHLSQQQVQAYNSAYMDEVEEEAAMLTAMYAQQAADIHPVHLAPQRQVHIQHPMMAPQTHHEMEDPRVTLLKNSNSFAQNGSQSLSPSTGYPTVNARSTTYANGAANWVPSQVAGYATGPLFTSPSPPHGLHGNTSASGSPVGGVSSNACSPTSTISSLSSFGSGSPVSVVPSHHSGFRRERSGSLTDSSPGNQSPVYELHHASHGAMQDFGVPRMGGICGASFVPSHHHMLGQGHGMQVQPQAMGLGGAMMMMA